MFHDSSHDEYSSHCTIGTDRNEKAEQFQPSVGIPQVRNRNFDQEKFSSQRKKPEFRFNDKWEKRGFDKACNLFFNKNYCYSALYTNLNFKFVYSWGCHKFECILIKLLLTKIR